MNYGYIFAIVYCGLTALMLAAGYIVDKHKSKAVTNKKRRNMIVK